MSGRCSENSPMWGTKSESVAELRKRRGKSKGSKGKSKGKGVKSYSLQFDESELEALDLEDAEAAPPRRHERCGVLLRALLLDDQVGLTCHTRQVQVQGKEGDVCEYVPLV